MLNAVIEVQMNVSSQERLKETVGKDYIFTGMREREGRGNHIKGNVRGGRKSNKAQRERLRKIKRGKGIFQYLHLIQQFSKVRHCMIFLMFPFYMSKAMFPHHAHINLYIIGICQLPHQCP